MLNLMLAMLGFTPALGAPTQDDAGSWSAYVSELPPDARIAAIYSVQPDGRRHVFFSRVRPGAGSNGSIQYDWFALRDSVDGEGAANRVWLTGGTCPALYGVLDWLSDIVVPSIWTGVRLLPAPTASERPLPSRPVHGPVHSIEGYGWTPDRDSARVTMSSSAGFLRQWGEAAQSALADCWEANSPLVQ